MLKCKNSFCVLFAVLIVVTSTSIVFFSTTKEASAKSVEPLSVQIALSKSSYFVTENAKASVVIQNNSSKKMTDVAVSVFSSKHMLVSGDESCIRIPVLEAGQTESYSFALALDRRTAGVSFFERILLFFSQLFHSYTPMRGILPYGSALQQEVSFRHGSANVSLEINAWYRIEPDQEETTALQDNVGETSDVQDVTTVPRPQVTLLDKYVIDIFKSGAFTLEMEMKQEGKTMPITLYEDEDNLAVEMTLTSLVMQDLELPAAFSNIGKVRFVITGKRSSNPRAYIMWPGNYMEMDNADKIVEMIREIKTTSALTQLKPDELEYCGKTTGIGYVCESYINPDENIQYYFYFAQTPEGYEGIVRLDRANLSTGLANIQIVMRLSQGIKNSKAFIIEGKQTTMEDFNKLFG